ncbi:hypothetical protein [Pedobacter antarcticus]|uniref:hypothetical protein n=1 Tax=Pedobacter antarcticus TaxID=34086 RepID=UPI001C58AE6A|nr:hypothetical protein [Pedobacter antarcticus]
MKKFLIICLLFCSAFIGTGISTASAQCAMCSISAEQGTKNGNTQGKGLNSGIVYLLVIPYILIAGMGVLWYKKYRTTKLTQGS